MIAALRASIEGIKQRGNTDLGDKTLLDALVPAVDELEAALPEGRDRRSQRAAAVARESAEATKGMLAQRGRASYTGERSRDSVDAGAVGDRGDVRGREQGLAGGRARARLTTRSRARGQACGAGLT